MFYHMAFPQRKIWIEKTLSNPFVVSSTAIGGEALHDDPNNDSGGDNPFGDSVLKLRCAFRGRVQDNDKLYDL